MIQSKKNRLLIIDDEHQIRRFIRLALAPHGFEVTEARTAEEGLEFAAQLMPDGIILDLKLPDMDGIRVLSQLREWFQGPIIILSVRDDEESVVKALDSGAQDYIRKPFMLGELLARLRLALRNNTNGSTSPIYSSGGLTVDLATRKVSLHGHEIRLTATEYELLKCLVKHRGKVLTHHQILSEVWGPKSVDHIQYLRVYIGHLRQKLEVDANQPRFIRTEPGVGYRLQLLDPIDHEPLTS